MVEEHFVVFEEGVIGDEFVEALVSGEKAVDAHVN